MVRFINRSPHAAKVAHLQLRPKPKVKRTPIVVFVAALIGIGIYAVLSSFAAGGKFDTVLAIGDESGGFANALIAMNPETGNKLRSITVPNLPTLAGCPATQNKAYLFDMSVNLSANSAMASLKPCFGGQLSSSQAIAKFNLQTGSFSGFLEGPADGATLTLHQQSNTIAALSSAGNQLWLYDSVAGRLRQKVDFGARSVTRVGVFPGQNFLAVAFSDGSISRIDVTTGQQQGVLKVNATFPKSAGIDTVRAVYSANAFWLIGEANGRSQLISIDNNSQTAQYPLGSTGTSMDLTPDGNGLMIATGCPSGTNCVQNPNRIYIFDTVNKQFQRNSQFEYLPIQTSPSRIRLDSSKENLMFDGVVTGANGVGQRFLFTLRLNTSQLLTARVPLPSSVWEPVPIDPALLDISSNTPATTVPNGVPAGGGIGSGGIAGAPVPIDEIERLLGVSIYDIDWSTISDDTIRSFGYDPATVRRYIAQLKLASGQNNLGNSASIECRLGNATGAAQIAAIERVLGSSLLTFDFSQVSDEQIRKFGADPSQLRSLVAEYQKKGKQASGNDPCGNSFTQDSFVVEQGSNKAGSASGSVTQVTAQTRFDLFKGGWVVVVRWQAPGGAANFTIYARDEKDNKAEKKLVTVDGLDRQATFGGFSRLALSPLENERYTIAVVPQQADGTIGAPTAVKTKIQCYLVWCRASKVN